MIMTPRKRELSRRVGIEKMTSSQKGHMGLAIGKGRTTREIYADELV